jgi:hypothetical protein
MSTKGVEIQAEEEAGVTGGKGAEDAVPSLGQPHIKAEDAVKVSLGEHTKDQAKCRIKNPKEKISSGSGK